MTTELHVANGILEGRLHSVREDAQRRTVLRDRREQRRARRAARRTAR